MKDHTAVNGLTFTLGGAGWMLDGRRVVSPRVLKLLRREARGRKPQPKIDATAAMRAALMLGAVQRFGRDWFVVRHGLFAGFLRSLSLDAYSSIPEFEGEGDERKVVKQAVIVRGADARKDWRGAMRLLAGGA